MGYHRDSSVEEDRKTKLNYSSIEISWQYENNKEMTYNSKQCTYGVPFRSKLCMNNFGHLT